MRVLAIEDHRPFLALMRSHLGKRGLTVDTSESVEEGLLLALSAEHDVILLDLELPDGDGSTLVKRLRSARNHTPIIVLSGRGQIVERVQLLEMGADDYVVKPVDLDELVARIHAVTRRRAQPSEQQVTFAGVSFDQKNRQAIVDGRPVMLRPREAALLEALLRRAGQPIHREALLSNLYGLDEEIGSNSLDVHVHHLRRRLADAGARVTIATIRGHGYALQVRHS